MDEKDKKAYIDDFKKADINKKLDLWLYAMDQEALWEEIMDEMSKIARISIMKTGGKPIINQE